GDNVSATWSLPEAGDPVDGDPPIDAKFVDQYFGPGSFKDFTLAQAQGSADFTHSTVSFSFPVNPASATNTANYKVSGLTVSGATLNPNGTDVLLTTDKQAGGTNYVVTVNNVTDVLGRTLPAHSTASLGAFILAKGGV